MDDLKGRWIACQPGEGYKRNEAYESVSLFSYILVAGVGFEPATFGL